MIALIAHIFLPIEKDFNMITQPNSASRLLPNRKLLSILVALFSLLMTAPSLAIVILDDTYQESGFKSAEQLAQSPQFKPLMYLSGHGSGVWIGNYEGHGYILTAGHMFPPGYSATNYTYHGRDGGTYTGEKVFLHPLWNENSQDRTGYDFAIVRLGEEVTDAGSQAALYDGSAEKGQLLTFMGYGYRGTGKKGQDKEIDTEDKPAAAQAIIEEVVAAVEPTPDHGNAGNHLGTWLPKEDGSVKNPYDPEGSTKPSTPLAGGIAEGDSGGPAWIMTQNGWAVAGVNSDGTGNVTYGDQSWFARVSHIRSWIESIVPTATFVH